MAIPQHLKTQIEPLLSESQKQDISILESSSVSGGSINQAFRLTTNRGYFFLKHFPSPTFSDWFEAESNGLILLSQKGKISTPDVLQLGKDFLVLEWIEEGYPNEEAWVTFGQQLAIQHTSTSASFGLDHNNYMGSLPQKNDRRDTWSEFFVEMRLEPQLKLAIDTGRISTQAHTFFEAVFSKMDQRFPKEPPSLLHGDLWSGNFLIDQNQKAVLIDPAVYYGHREMDLAMTRLFGGFSSSFYQGYVAENPLEQGWEERIDLANLYPLLIHVNLFGEGYVRQVMSLVKRFQ